MIRPAVESDVPALIALIRGLAEYEKLLHAVEIVEQDLRTHLFGPTPAAEALIAEDGGKPVGFALFFTTFSTFRGKPGVYLEDLFVVPEMRGRGFGKALMLAVAKLAVRRGCGRMEWSVLDWNAPAIAFYESLGAKPLDEWTMYRLTGDALAAAGGGG